MIYSSCLLKPRHDLEQYQSLGWFFDVLRVEKIKKIVKDF